MYTVWTKYSDACSDHQNIFKETDRFLPFVPTRGSSTQLLQDASCRNVLIRSPCAIIQPGVREWRLRAVPRRRVSPRNRLLTGRRSACVARAVLEGGHLHFPAQPVHFQLAEVVFLIVLYDELLQLADLSLHLAPQLTFHLVQSLEAETGWRM